MNTLPPLSSIFNPDGYPIDALPKAILEPAMELHMITKAPFTLCVSAVLAAISLACSHGMRVKRFNNIITPIVLFLLVIAQSGERKSSTDGLATEVFRRFEAAIREWVQALKERYRSNLTAWQAEKKGVTAAIKAKAMAGKDCTELNDRLREIMAREPIAPNVPRLLLSDITADALLQHLSTSPVAGILSSEGGAEFKGPTLNNLPLLNVLWDRGAYRVDRKNEDPVDVENAALTVSLMVQEPVLREFLDGKGSNARDNGFGARFLITKPTSTQGFRIENSTVPIPRTHLAAFEKRIWEVLESKFTKDGQFRQEITTLEFDQLAKNRCVEFTNWVECHIGPNGYFADVKDAASKIADNAARMAANFHAFQGFEGEISEETAWQAIRICTWHLYQFKAVFGVLPERPQHHIDAVLLQAWLRDRYFRTNSVFVEANDMLKRGPSQLRKKVRMQPALQHLWSLGMIMEVKNGRKSFIQLNPPLFQVTLV